MMISILSQIVEFRNGESGLHVMRINMITGMLLERLAVKSDKYPLSWAERSMITTASSLHDIGKIGIPEEIPISAQVVSLADVYDALVSERVYKKAFSPEKALEMIQSGECGSFNPLLLECLLDIRDRVKEEYEQREE